MQSTNTYIAVIDDDESLRRSLGRVLRLMGFHALMFSSAELFLADPAREHFACLLVDIQLGGMSGIELLQKLAAQGDHTPMIFITAHENEHTRHQANQAGCAGYFNKSDSSDDIIEAIKVIVALPASR
jgi:FixJ family two-component response regulator